MESTPGTARDSSSNLKNNQELLSNRKQRNNHLIGTLKQIILDLEKIKSENIILMNALTTLFPYETYRQARPDVSCAASEDADLLDHYIQYGHSEINLIELITASKQTSGLDSQIDVSPLPKQSESFVDSGCSIPKDKNQSIADNGMAVRLQKILVDESIKLNEEVRISIQYCINHLTDQNNFVHTSSNVQPVLIGSGEESLCVACGGIVTKFYNDNYYRYNRLFERPGESHIISQLTNDLSIEIIQNDLNFMSIPVYGIKTGERITTETDNVQLYLHDDDILRLIEWLSTLEEKLKADNISHNDINLCNILHDSATGVFKLIDYSWATISSDKNNITTSINDFPSYLNSGFKDDCSAIQILTRVLIRQLIGKMGVNLKDGSSIKQGYLYNQIDIKEFDDLPYHKNHALDEARAIETHAHKKLSKSNILEIGTSTGAFTFYLSDKVNTIVGYEADKAAFNVAQALKIYTKADNVTFNNEKVSAKTIMSFNPDFDICICTNVHMWIEKQLGKSETIDMMKILSKKVKSLYFQTAHLESGGLYILDYLKDKKDVVDYLEQCGFTEIEEVSRTTVHGGIRILFYCKSLANS